MREGVDPELYSAHHEKTIQERAGSRSMVDIINDHVFMYRCGYFSSGVDNGLHKRRKESVSGAADSLLG